MYSPGVWFLFQHHLATDLSEPGAGFFVRSSGGAGGLCRCCSSAVADLVGGVATDRVVQSFSPQGGPVRDRRHFTRGSRERQLFAGAAVSRPAAPRHCLIALSGAADSFLLGAAWARVSISLAPTRALSPAS